MNYKIELPTRVCIMSDCTRNLDCFQGELDVEPDVQVFRVLTSPPFSREGVYEVLSSVPSEGKVLVVLHSNADFFAAFSVYVNSKVEVKNPEVPVLGNPDEVTFLEAWDEELVNINKEKESSYDSALRPIVSDFLRIQALNSPEEAKEGETIQILESEQPKMKVEELIETRKSRSEEVKAKVEESKSVEE